MRRMSNYPMPSLVIILIGCAVIAFLEWLAWHIFEQKIAGLLFPRASDASLLRFFSLPRMRAVAASHMLLLCVIYSLVIVFLW